MTITEKISTNGMSGTKTFQAGKAAFQAFFPLPLRNEKNFKNFYTVLQKTGQGIKMAANTGYKTGYFLAKHPGVELTKNQIQKNYKTGLLAFLGIIIGLFGAFKFMKMKKK